MARKRRDGIRIATVLGAALFGVSGHATAQQSDPGWVVPAPQPTATYPAPQPTATYPAPQPTATYPAPQPTVPGQPPATWPPATQPGPAWGTPQQPWGQPPQYGVPTYPHPYGAPPTVLPRRKPYREGDPIPPGYHLESHPRSGLVTAGWILTGIGYGTGMMAALSADFANETGWLAVPFVGPWMTLGKRRSCGEQEDGTVVDCVGDVFAVMGLITDGIIQTLGGTFLLIGYTATKEVLVLDTAIQVRPMRVGTGYGAGVSGAF